jgi:hypothetical protein
LAAFGIALADLVGVGQQGDDGDEAMQSVLSYFVHNPEAADDVEGIARWRLLEETIAHTIDQTQRALRRLVAEGHLVERTAPGMKPIYRLNPEGRTVAWRSTTSGASGQAGGEG